MEPTRKPTLEYQDILVGQYVSTCVETWAYCKKIAKLHQDSELGTETWKLKLRKKGKDTKAYSKYSEIADAILRY